MKKTPISVEVTLENEYEMIKNKYFLLSSKERDWKSNKGLIGRYNELHNLLYAPKEEEPVEEKSTKRMVGIVGGLAIGASAIICSSKH